MKRVLSNVYTLFLMTVTAASAFAQTSIRFEVSFSEPQAHYADIQMEVSGFEGGYLDVKMPVWTPGSYLVRNIRAIWRDSRPTTPKVTN